MSNRRLERFSNLRSWLLNNGGGFNPKTTFSEDISGSHIIATDALESDSTIVSCPFNQIITKTLAKESISQLLGDSEITSETNGWTERQWISTYIVLHWISDSNIEYAKQSLNHFEYLDTLPTSEQLRTPLHFTEEELSLFKGTNIYGATLDRERDWKLEWTQCRSFLEKNSAWGEPFTWERYLTAATYLSSRAFPSSLLSETPSLIGTPSTEPILIPGVDSLNHARGQAVSWVVTYPRKDEPYQEPKISLILHTPAHSGQELFNNYGPKPNSELILGYGFSIPTNPDDSIVLKIGGINDKKWEIGRNAQKAEGLWAEILSTLVGPDSVDATYEDILDGASILQEMVQALIDRLPNVDDPNAKKARPEIQTMFRHYIEGQAAILQSLIDFSKAREQDAVKVAQAQGIDLVLE